MNKKNYYNYKLIFKKRVKEILDIYIFYISVMQECLLRALNSMLFYIYKYQNIALHKIIV